VDNLQNEKQPENPAVFLFQLTGKSFSAWKNLS